MNSASRPLSRWSSSASLSATSRARCLGLAALKARRRVQRYAGALRLQVQPARLAVRPQVPRGIRAAVEAREPAVGARLQAGLPPLRVRDLRAGRHQERRPTSALTTISVLVAERREREQWAASSGLSIARSFSRLASSTSARSRSSACGEYLPTPLLPVATRSCCSGINSVRARVEPSPAPRVSAFDPRGEGALDRRRHLRRRCGERRGCRCFPGRAPRRTAAGERLRRTRARSRRRCRSGRRLPRSRAARRRTR